jgi:hypothetical protein
MQYISSTTKQLCWVLAFALFCLWSGLPEYLAYAEAVQQTSPTEVTQNAYCKSVGLAKRGTAPRCSGAHRARLG